jgi:uncharacterized protein
MRNPLAPLEQFRSPLVRDLVWALLSPTLINSNNGNHNPSPRWFREAFTLIESHLRKLDQDDAPLRQYLDAAPTPRLGLYFERLWSYWLQHNSRYELLAHNLQVMQDQHTLGEFDFIVRDTHADQIEHWELAVKFYLGVPPLREAHHWFGANTRDRLDLKYCHLVDKQLTLSETLPGRNACLAQGWNVSQRRLISKGRLYYPYTGAPPAVQCAPRCIDPTHENGFWINHSAFLQLASTFPQAGYHWLERTEWLVHHGTALQSFATIREKLEQQLHPRPMQLWISGWQAEPFRLFVVPDDWQASALESLRQPAQQ